MVARRNTRDCLTQVDGPRHWRVLLRKPPGPAPEVLKIEGNLKDAMLKLISKKRPVGGWPKDQM